MWRKFCGPLDILLSLYQTKLGKVQACYISKQPLTAIQALRAHKSQYVWYATCFMTVQKRLLIAQMYASKDALGYQWMLAVSRHCMLRKKICEDSGIYSAGTACCTSGFLDTLM